MNSLEQNLVLGDREPIGTTEKAGAALLPTLSGLTGASRHCVPLLAAKRAGRKRDLTGAAAEEAPGLCNSNRSLDKSPPTDRNTSTPLQREAANLTSAEDSRRRRGPPCPAPWQDGILCPFQLQEEHTTKTQTQAQHEAAGISDQQFEQVKRDIFLRQLWATRLT